MASAHEPLSAAVELACELIARPSVTPDDGGCQALLSARLTASGFACRQLDFGPVKNLWAVHGSEGPTLLFVGHTDVVPPGPESEWHSPPFAPTLADGLLTGRGAADMKGAVAAMVVALQQFVAAQPTHPGRVGLLLTSDEEGIAADGVVKAAPALKAAGGGLDYCLVGEPSSQERLADNVRVGRRGSLNGQLTVRGKQGHAAFPELARNAIHLAAEAIAQLCRQSWDDGDAVFPATSFQFTELHAGVGASNVVPGELTAAFNFRFNPASPETVIRQRVAQLLRELELDFKLDWQLSGQPFITRGGELLAAVDAAVTSHCGGPPRHDTGGGTSDGRFLAPLGAQVVELGLLNATIHKVNECVPAADIDKLAQIYFSVMTELTTRL